MQTVSSAELAAGKKMVLFAVPGAFTPTCSLKHLPGFIENADAIKAKGVDVLACVAVNDVFVMDAWGKSVQAEGKVMMLADGSADLARSLGVELDLKDKGLKDPGPMGPGAQGPPKQLGGPGTPQAIGGPKGPQPI